MYKNNSFLFAADVYTICQPLFKKFSLNAFSYSKIYTDGSRAELWSDAYAMEHSFFGKKYIDKVYTPQYLGQEKVVLYEKKIETYPISVRKKLMDQISDQKTIFNYDNALLISEFFDDFCEYFFFYSPTENFNAINTYLSEMDQLKKFCKYFKKRAKNLIKSTDDDKLIQPWISNTCEPRDKIVYCENELILLTKREIEMGYMLVEGKTAKEISKIFCISQRTVEHHIANIKDKLNIRKKSDLVYALIKGNMNAFE